MAVLGDVGGVPGVESAVWELGSTVGGALVSTSADMAGDSNE